MPLLKIGKLRISFGFLFLLLGLLWLDGTVYSLYLLGSIAAHELCHIWGIWRVNGQIQSVTLRAFRISIELPQSLISYGDEIKIAFAGPLANLCILAAVLGWTLFVCPLPDAPFLCAANLLLFGVNMLPIEFLDGGRMLQAYLLTQMEPDTAAGICGVVSGLALFPLLGLGALLWAKTGYNLSLLGIGVFLALSFAARILTLRR